MISQADDYETASVAFRSRRDLALRAEDGWLAATGLYVLVEGQNDLPFGVVTVRGDFVHVVIHPGLEVTRLGKFIRETRLRPDQDDDVLRIGTVSHQLIRRGETLAIRTRDPENPRRRDFRGTEWFPLDRSWRFRARCVPLEHPLTIDVTYSIAATEQEVVDYVLVFERNRVAYTLQPIVEPKRLLILFGDETNGELSSSIGRYLYAPLPHLGTTILDFNQALSPGCAYNEHVPHPIPPKRNILRMRVEAGEMAPRV